MSQKRRYQRFDVSLPVIVRHCGRLIPATVQDLSIDGMLVVTSSPDVSSGSSVEVTFDLGETKDVSVMGSVRHIERTEENAKFGVQFINPLSESNQAVREFVNRIVYTA